MPRASRPAYPVGARHAADVPQANLCVITATQQVTRLEGAPGQAITLSLVTCAHNHAHNFEVNASTPFMPTLPRLSMTHVQACGTPLSHPFTVVNACYRPPQNPKQLHTHRLRVEFTCEPQVWSAHPVWVWPAVVLAVVKDKHVCSHCLGGNDEAVLRHVPAHERSRQQGLASAA
jgi:hypothetical protein